MLRSQSSNETFPTASHIATIHSVDVLLKVITNLGFSLKKKGKEFINMPKSGRTHLMDAMPVTLGAEFIAYGLDLEYMKKRLKLPKKPWKIKYLSKI
jgi:aspartate ammonia-lyase